jgi:toxin ParE1/3/4
MPIVWLAAAVQDVLFIRTFIAQENPQAAQNVALRIDRAISLLGTMTNMGRPGRIFGTRELVMSGTSFLAVYRVENGRVEILRIFHRRQPFPESLEKS